MLAPGKSCTWDVTFRPSNGDATRRYAALFDYVVGRPPAIDTGAHHAIRLTGRLRP